MTDKKQETFHNNLQSLSTSRRPNFKLVFQIQLPSPFQNNKQSIHHTIILISLSIIYIIYNINQVKNKMIMRDYLPLKPCCIF